MPVFALLVALAASVLVACDNPSSAVEADGASLSQDALVAQSRTVIAEAGVDAGEVDLAALNRRILTGFVRHQLITAAAGAAGVSVGDDVVDSYLDQNGRSTVATALRVPQADVVAATRDVLELQKLVTAGTSGLPVTDVSVTAECAAAQTVAEVTRLRRLFAADPVDGPGRAGASVAGYDLLTAVAAAPDGVYRAAVDQVVTVNPVADAGVKVCLVTGRTVAAGTLTVAAINTYSTFDDRLNAASLALTTLPAAAGVQVNPRFGTWDPVSAQVVPSVAVS